MHDSSVLDSQIWMLIREGLVFTTSIGEEGKRRKITSPLSLCFSSPTACWGLTCSYSKQEYSQVCLTLYWLQSSSLDSPTGLGSLVFVDCCLHWEHPRALHSSLTGQPSCTLAPRLGETSHTLLPAGLACPGKRVQAGGDVLFPAPFLAPCSSAPTLAGP